MGLGAYLSAQSFIILYLVKYVLEKYYKIFLVMLIGGKEGNVYATVTETNAFGPVCDDTWNLISVSFYLF